MGSIESYQTANGRRYRVRYRDPDHRSREKAGFTRKFDAEQFLASTTVTTSRGEWVDPSSAKAEVGALAQEWLASRSNLKPSSLRPLEGSWASTSPPSGRIAASARSGTAKCKRGSRKCRKSAHRPS